MDKDLREMLRNKLAARKDRTKAAVPNLGVVEGVDNQKALSVKLIKLVLLARSAQLLGGYACNKLSNIEEEWKGKAS